MAKKQFSKSKRLNVVRPSHPPRHYRVKVKVVPSYRKRFPEEFPFWVRMKIGKNRTALVIDEEKVKNKKNGRMVDGFVHREAIHTKKKDYEEIKPNPDRSDSRPMFLKRPAKKPQTLFKPHNKKLDMPKHLEERYKKNNKK